MKDNSNIEIMINKILGCAIEVHKGLGPGLLESVYHDALAIEFDRNNIHYIKEFSIPVIYKGIKTSGILRADFFDSNSVIIELKSIKHIEDIHIAQTLTYMKLLNVHIGLLLNFNSTLMKEGIKRLIL